MALSTPSPYGDSTLSQGEKGANERRALQLLTFRLRHRFRPNKGEQRLIATGSQVNVAEQRLKDTQSQGDDSPATPLRLTSSSAAINRSEAAPRSSAHL